MKFKRLAVLGILLVSLSGSGVVSYASEGASHVYETDSSYDVSDWIKPDGTVETNFTYENAPWIYEDGTVDMKAARYFRIANAEAGGTDVNEIYHAVRDGVKVYREKDRNSGIIESLEFNDFIYIHLRYEDGWAWSGEYQGYVPWSDLSELGIERTRVNEYYEIAGNNVKAYKYKDTSSEVMAEYDLIDEVFIDEIHNDGWAWSEDIQGYIKSDDLLGDKPYITEASADSAEVNEDNGKINIGSTGDEDMITITIKGIDITISFGKR